MNILLMAVMMGLAMFAFHGHGHHHTTPESKQQAPSQKDGGIAESPAHKPTGPHSEAQREANANSKLNPESKLAPKAD